MASVNRTSDCSKKNLFHYHTDSKRVQSYSLQTLCVLLLGRACCQFEQEVYAQSMSLWVNSSTPFTCLSLPAESVSPATPLTPLCPAGSAPPAAASQLSVDAVTNNILYFFFPGFPPTRPGHSCGWGQVGPGRVWGCGQYDEGGWQEPELTHIGAFSPGQPRAFSGPLEPTQRKHTGQQQRKRGREVTTVLLGICSHPDRNELRAVPTTQEHTNHQFAMKPHIFSLDHFHILTSALCARLRAEKNSPTAWAFRSCWKKL